MRTPITIGLLIATLALAVSGVAFGDSSVRRVPTLPASNEASPLPKALAQAQRKVLKVTQDRVRCRSLRCINKSLNQLASAFNALNDCLSYIEVARFPGYVYSNDGGATTFLTGALDTTDPGTGTKVVILTC